MLPCLASSMLRPVPVLYHRLRVHRAVPSTPRIHHDAYQQLVTQLALRVHINVTVAGFLGEKGVNLMERARRHTSWLPIDQWCLYILLRQHPHSLLSQNACSNLNFKSLMKVKK